MYYPYPTRCYTHSLWWRWEASGRCSCHWPAIEVWLSKHTSEKDKRKREQWQHTLKYTCPAVGIRCWPCLTAKIPGKEGVKKHESVSRQSVTVVFEVVVEVGWGVWNHSGVATLINMATSIYFSLSLTKSTENFHQIYHQRPCQSELVCAQANSQFTFDWGSNGPSQ